MGIGGSFEVSPGDSKAARLRPTAHMMKLL